MSPSASPTDDLLVQRAQRGDRGGMVLLYQRYVGEIYGYAFNQLGSVQDAEDVTSETFMRVVNAIGSYRAESSFRTWLYAIAHNQVRDHWRRNGHHQNAVELDLARTAVADDPMSDGTGADGTGSDDGPPEANPRATALGVAVLAQLPENYRQVLQLRVMDGRSIRDTAAELGLSESNVKVMQHRALKRAAVIAEDLDKGIG
jgi:RNA polymerase sigma factor (sigma-70 family)